MKVAVTGATGFIGRYVVANLLKTGAQVVALTRDITKIESHPSLTVIECDIHHWPEQLYEKMGKPDVLLHLGWGHLDNFRALEHFTSELPAHYSFLTSLISQGLPHLVVAGTCSEYGLQTGEMKETNLPDPVLPYPFAKNALRQQLEFFKTKNSFGFTWARIFFLWGEGQGSCSLYSQLKRAALAGEAQFNMSGGEQVRDYLTVEEMAAQLASLALAKADIGVVNVCSAKPTTVKSLVQGIVESKGWNIELNLGFYPYASHEPMSFWGDNTKLRTFLGR